jgi:hypothetical protein
VTEPKSQPNSRKLALVALLPGLLFTSAQTLQPARVLAQSGGAQAAMLCHSLGTQDEVAPDKLPLPQKLSGIGNAHIKITATWEAQAWFDQGLNLYHDFWDYESARAFEQSVRVDPQCAMCYWGIYLAETFRHSSSKHFADQALAEGACEQGRAFVYRGERSARSGGERKQG